ncbi:MAG: hypothetical protein ACRD0A_16220 [Acidimicrobiales bacterium]
MNTSEKSTALGAGRLTPHDVEGLLDFADGVLPTLRHRDGLFCFDRGFDSPELRGVSVRYSILVLLGLLRRRTTGRDFSIDVEDLHRSIASRVDTLDVGDLSLLLWAEVRMGAASAPVTLARLARRSADQERQGRLEGMEAAWFVLGTAEATVAGLPAREQFDAAYAHFRARRSPSSPLFRHNATGRGRARLPNFATQIYSLLALAETVRHGLAHDAEGAGRALAAKLIELRLPDGGWPWLFHADRGSVVERYEVYSVHQDAMAPMALFALAEATGEQSYARAAVEGFQWCFGNNELGFDFYDRANHFAHRSIKRRGWAHSANLWTNTALGGVLGSAARTDAGGLEINATCRPYHLGWILEAWSGREHLNSLVAGEQTTEVVG